MTIQFSSCFNDFTRKPVSQFNPFWLSVEWIYNQTSWNVSGRYFLKNMFSFPCCLPIKLTTVECFQGKSPLVEGVVIPPIVIIGPLLLLSPCTLQRLWPSMTTVLWYCTRENDLFSLVLHHCQTCDRQRVSFGLLYSRTPCSLSKCWEWGKSVIFKTVTCISVEFSL